MMPFVYPPQARPLRLGVALAALVGFVVLVGAGCGRSGLESDEQQRQQPPPTTVGSTTCAPAVGGRVPLADTGYTVELPKGWCLYEWTKDDPVFREYPYNGTPDPFLIRTTHGVKNREWAIEYPKGTDIGVGCTLYYFLGTVDQAYLEAEESANQQPQTNYISPSINSEYVTKYQVDANIYFERTESRFQDDPNTYYDLFAIKGQIAACSEIAASLNPGVAKER